MREVKPTWVQKNLGLQLGHTELTHLTNLRFADDVLLTSTKLTHLRQMLLDVATAAKARGLDLHPDKTKIISSLTKRRGAAGTSQVQVGDMNIEVLPYAASVKCFGRHIAFDSCHEKEIQHRIASAWRRFSIASGRTNWKAFLLE